MNNGCTNDKDGDEMALLPYKMDYLTEEMTLKARRELSETDEIRKKAIEQFRNHIKEQKNLECPTDDLTLLTYLRARKFDVNKAIKILHSYFQAKKNFPEVYAVEDFEGLRKSIVDKFSCVLPYRDSDGCVVILFNFKKWNVKETKLCQIIQYMTCVAMTCVDDVATQVCGLKIIADTNGISLQHLPHVHPKYLHLIAVGIKNCIPMRLKALHIMNESLPVRLIWNIISFALSEKILNRVHFHGSDKRSLLKYFDARLLPREYGGSLDFDNAVLLKDADQKKQSYLDRLLHTGYK